MWSREKAKSPAEPGTQASRDGVQRPLSRSRQQGREGSTGLQGPPGWPPWASTPGSSGMGLDPPCPPAPCPLSCRDKSCALSGKTEPGLEAPARRPPGRCSPPPPPAASPLCLCSGLRARYLLQRRARPVCAMRAGDLPGQGRPAQLHAMPQQRRARPGWCPQRIRMWR